LGINYKINYRLIRGLDYYMHTVFEYKAQGIGAIDTIGGGGRYHGLVSQLGGPDHPAIGFGIGMERLVLLLCKQGAIVDTTAPLMIYLIGLGERAEEEVVKLLHTLRTAGITAEKDYGGRKIKAQMKSAARLQTRFVGIIGDEELLRGEIVLKQFATGEQQRVKVTKVVDIIQQS